MLQKYNNKLAKITDIDNQMFSGRCLYKNREDFGEELDRLSVKADSGWIKLLGNEIKSIEALNQLGTLTNYSCNRLEVSF